MAVLRAFFKLSLQSREVKELKMISNTRVRKILKNPNLTDEEIELLMDDIYRLVRIFFDDQKSKGGSNKTVGVIDTASQKDDDEK